MKRLVTILLAAAALSACAADPATTESSPLARAGHPAGFRYAAASSVKSGSCTVAVSSSELLAFGCPSDEGTFVEYTPARELDHCTVFNQWAATHGASGVCHDKDGSVHVEAKFGIDGQQIHAELHHGRLRVTHVTAKETAPEPSSPTSSTEPAGDSTHSEGSHSEPHADEHSKDEHSKDEHSDDSHSDDSHSDDSHSDGM